ncbi:MAG: peptide ABC transporter substrate-binding protein [Gammaproteobacteria bacterium]|nr:peptide ABC transporter substrate-binding protein [Gammaproteobacteria bacterium]
MKNCTLFTTIVFLGLFVGACSGPADESQDIGDEQQNTDAPEENADTHLKLLYWQAPTTLNPYLSGGTKEIEAASLVLEPLANYDEEAQMVPTLAVEIPTIENGGFSEDLQTITWKLRNDVLWSDGSPFTADDVVFTWQYCTHPEMGCYRINNFSDVDEVVAVDSHTVRITFSKIKAHPYAPFVGSLVPILQKNQFEECLGARAQECTEQNFAPIGTGPFRVIDFRANDVSQYVANENYREEGKPFFKAVTLKGGGDAASAARAVVETGEYDFGWNLQVEPEILDSMAKAEKGKVLYGVGSQVERIIVNLTNEDSSLGPERRSQYLDGTNPHPFLSEFAVRRALSLAIDRSILVETGYGRAGEPECNVVPAPEYYVSDSNEECKVQNIEEANRLLDEAGWVLGSDGVRSKDGVRLSILYQTSTNSVRQGNQALVKHMWEQIGVETELRNIDGAVFFGSDVASPDTYQKFFADVQMYTNNFDGEDPSEYLRGWSCSEIPGPDNNWAGTNIPRACSEEFDTLVDDLSSVTDKTERADIIKRLNDMVVLNYWVIPLVHRARVSAVSNALKGVTINGWDSELWNAEDWHR